LLKATAALVEIVTVDEEREYVELSVPLYLYVRVGEEAVSLAHANERYP